jgi:hypothetical protein
MATCYHADLLMSGLVKALDLNKQPKAKLAVMEFAIANLGLGSPAGIPSQALIK